MTPAILVHGNASWARSWRFVTALLGDSAVARDLPGFGEAPDDGRPFEDVVSSWCGESPCVLVGAGMGGQVALRVARRLPRVVEHVVVVGPAGLPGGHGRLSALGRRDSGAALLRAAGSTVARRQFLSDQLARPEEASADVRESLVEGLQRSRGFARLSREAGPPSLAGMGDLTCRITVLWGELSRVAPLVRYGDLMDHLPPAAWLEVLEGEGHALAVEAPERVAAEIRNAIAGRTPRGDRWGAA